MMPNTKDSDFVANYELNSYKYSNFWKDREYEHKSEVMLLEKLFRKFLPDLNIRVIMDVGGAFGRLTPSYAPQAKHVILADYSAHELTEGVANIQGKPFASKISFLALNAYKMPLKDESLGALLSVRVMHHLKTPELFFGEVSRVLTPGGVAIVEFAHKNHILALFKALIKGKIQEFLATSVTEVSHKADSQGIAAGQISLMYNFSLSYLEDVAKTAGLDVAGVYSCSFLRIPLLKKIVPMPFLLLAEQILQNLFFWTHITPSLFLVLKKPGTYIPSAMWNMETQLVCPTCQTKVIQQNGALLCIQGHSFVQKYPSVVDLRDPRPETVTF